MTEQEEVCPCACCREQVPWCHCHEYGEDEQCHCPFCAKGTGMTESPTWHRDGQYGHKFTPNPSHRGIYGLAIVGALLFAFCPEQSFVSAREHSWSTWPLAGAGILGLAMMLAAVLWMLEKVRRAG